MNASDFTTAQKQTEPALPRKALPRRNQRLPRSGTRALPRKRGTRQTNRYDHRARKAGTRALPRKAEPDVTAQAEPERYPRKTAQAGTALPRKQTRCATAQTMEPNATARKALPRKRNQILTAEPELPRRNYSHRATLICNSKIPERYRQNYRALRTMVDRACASRYMQLNNKPRGNKNKRCRTTAHILQTSPPIRNAYRVLTLVGSKTVGNRESGTKQPRKRKQGIWRQPLSAKSCSRICCKKDEYGLG